MRSFRLYGLLTYTQKKIQLFEGTNLKSLDMQSRLGTDSLINSRDAIIVICCLRAIVILIKACMVSE